VGESLSLLDQARGEPLGNELDRADVSAAVAQGAARVVVEGVAVAVAEAAGTSDLVAEVDGHLVHEAEGTAACRLGETNGVRVELGEGGGRQALRPKLRLEGPDHVRTERTEIRAYAGAEDREQRSGVASAVGTCGDRTRADSGTSRRQLGEVR
jgi:hypothetical protein